ncbi:hypothetical protein BofuT4_uP019030.1 [Botrytis cinerea T4]|uniref:Uncharacterized protein n=1 Tax=Botryotinia fuckeliana (strain T4) TaxID=999810 RepID=G2YIR0_BOTF4|nr:hypothetical protein BofuT4_uP019030.1 [Botrytis cinerea T4]
MGSETRLCILRSMFMASSICWHFSTVPDIDYQSPSNMGSETRLCILRSMFMACYVCWYFSTVPDIDTPVSR